MLKKLMLAGLAVGMTALNAPVAHAAVVRAECGFDAAAQATVTGGGAQATFTGAAWCVVTFDDGNGHTVRGYITVDGVEQASTPTASGSVVVIAAGQVTYNAPEGSTVDLCTEIDGVTVSCGPADEQQIPPQAVIDLLDTVFATLDSVLIPIEEQLDPTICTLLKAAAPGIPGVVDITPEGDTTVVGVGPFWDCPPYGNLFPPA
jgi:hypothetical protein